MADYNSQLVRQRQQVEIETLRAKLGKAEKQAKQASNQIQALKKQHK